MMRRRDFLQTLAAGSLTALIPVRLSANNADSRILTNGRHVALKCLGTVNGARWLDGRTANATVGLAPKMGIKKHSGTHCLDVKPGECNLSLLVLSALTGSR